MAHFEMTPGERSEVRKALIAAGLKTRGLTDDQLYNQYQKLTTELTPTYEDDAQLTPQKTPTATEIEDMINSPATAPNSPAAPAASDHAILDAIKAAIGPQTATLDEQRVIDLIKLHSKAPTTYNVQTVDRELKPINIEKNSHPALADVVEWLASGENVYLVGGAGSGKTTIAEQAANLLNKDFYHNGALLTKYELTGFIDANGKYHTTAFKEAFEKGGLYLFDELDASNPQAVLAMNQALSNGEYTFPDGKIRKHKEFVAIAAANTLGNGATLQYVGRNPMDGASLNRFVKVHVEYDKGLELFLAEMRYNHNGGQLPAVPALWVAFIQEVRQISEDNKWPHLITPRDSMQGASKLAVNPTVDITKLAKQTALAAFSDDQMSQVKTALENTAHAIKGLNNV